MKRVLAVIVTYNGMQWLDRCLGSLRSSSLRPDVYVFDNASTDGTPDAVAARFPEAFLVRSSENLGFARANDRGLRYALEKGYDYVYLLNQDAWVLPDTLSRLADALSSGDWGLISPLQMRPDGRTPDARFRRHYHGPLAPDGTVRPVRFVMAAHWMLSASCLRTTGLFSPAFRHYGEDNNYCDRVRYHGFRIGVLPAAVAIHDRQARRQSKEVRMYRNAQYARVRLSDPGARFGWQRCAQGFRLLLMCLRWLSVQPLRHAAALLADGPALRRWREDSKRPGAFLEPS